MTTQKQIERYFKLDKQLKEDIIRVSNKMGQAGFQILDSKISGFHCDMYFPVGEEPDDIGYLDTTYCDTEYKCFDAKVRDRDGGFDSYTIPTKYLGMTDAQLDEEITRLNENKAALEKKEAAAEKRRNTLEEKKAKAREYQLFLELCKKYRPKKKRPARRIGRHGGKS